MTGHEAAGPMRAVVATGRGGNDVLAVERRPVPQPGRGELLVRVRAAAINPRDWMIRSGRYPLQFLLPRTGLVLGSDLCGEVVAAGPGCTRFATGDRVHAMQPGRRFGAFADYAVVPEAVAAAVPEGLSDAGAAAMTLVGLTAWQGLVDQAKLEDGNDVLVIGASGGVGHMAVQVATALGARVTGVCSAASAEFVRGLGAADVIDRKRQRFQDTGRRWEVIFDAFGAAGFAASRVALTDRGVYVSTWPTPKVITASLATRLAPWGRQCRLVAVRSDGGDLAALGDLVTRGLLRPTIAQTFPLEDVAAALEASRSFATRGKLVLEMAD